MPRQPRKMMKVLMVCEAFGGGVFAYVSQLCNDLAGDIDITLAYSERPQTPSDYKELLDSRVNLIEIPEMGGISSPACVVRAVIALRRLEDTIRPDVVHLHSSLAGALGRIAYSGKKSKVVYTPHGYAHVLLGGGMKSFAYRFAERILGTRNHVTLTCCESEDQEARKFARKTAYIETGIDLGQFDEKLGSVEEKKSDKFTVYTLGRVCSQKRPDVFNRIAELVPEARFLWIGGGELEDELSADNVVVTGWLPRFEALSLAKGADAFVLCSRGEAIAMSLLENMYMGPLTLVSNVMGNKSVVKDGVNGYVCETPEEFAERIDDAMRVFPDALSRQARRDIETVYNTKEMRRKFIDFYYGLVSANS